MALAADTVVLGAGVVGLAVAERLSRGGGEVLVLERHAAPGTETTSRNSQVLHAGLYYPSGSLKARLCVKANAELPRWCDKHGVPLERVGKLIVATQSAEEAELERLLAQGRANGVTRLERVDAAFVQRREPEVRAVSALWSPDSGILDAHELVRSLEGAAHDQGATFAYKHALAAVEKSGAGYRLRLEGPGGEAIAVEARRVVNAAGLHADEVAALAGIDLDAAGYRQHWVKGHYFRVRGAKRVKTLVYPVPAKNLAGLGVHLTVGLDGDLRLGPDVQALPERKKDYRVPEALLEPFFAGASRFLPWLKPELLSPDQSGIRPKLSKPGEPFKDFVIAEESARGLPGWVNLLGIESPGLTCAMEIAAEVAALLG